MEASAVEHADRGHLPFRIPVRASFRTASRHPFRPVRVAFRAGSGGWARASVIAAVITVAAQISYPLLSGTALAVVTLLTVVLFATAGATHAAAALGLPAAVRLILAAGGISLVVEAVGMRTGYPFGRYTYATSLGGEVAGVPLVVPLAWTMMAYPTLLLARRLAAGTGSRTSFGAGRRVLVAALGGVTLAAWDLFLDPQLVADGVWTWQYPDPGLPGVPGVPLTNLAGWLLVGTGLTAVLDRLLPTAHRPTTAHRPATAVPDALLAWTWLGSTLANLAFFDRPALAGYGFVALGATVAPYLFLLTHDARRGVR